MKKKKQIRKIYNLDAEQNLRIFDVSSLYRLFICNLMTKNNKNVRRLELSNIYLLRKDKRLLEFYFTKFKCGLKSERNCIWKSYRVEIKAKSSYQKNGSKVTMDCGKKLLKMVFSEMLLFTTLKNLNLNLKERRAKKQFKYNRTTFLPS